MWPLSIPKGLRQTFRPRRRLAIAEACLIGLVAALAAVFLKVASGWLGGWRVSLSHLAPAGIVLPAVGFSFGFLAGWLVDRFATEAKGSGIPQVKAALAAFPIALDLRVALVKLLSCILALGSGLAIGRQGPTVQVGAALAGQLSALIPTSPDHRRQMIAAGAGAGLAAAFNAPLAGVLFAIEELLHDVSSFTLGTAILASFIGGVVSRLLGGRSLELNLQLTASQTSFSIPEIPFYLLLGVACGLLGALFCQGIFASLKFYQRMVRLSLPFRVGLAGMVSGAIVALLPVFFRDNTGMREFLLAGEASPQLAAIAFVAQFGLTLIAFGSGAPGGLFAPSLMLGSALGYLVGLLETNMVGYGAPTTYALAGMGAFFGAVSKAPITAIAIVFEMTTDFNLLLPLMIGSVTSYLVADAITSGSIYDRILELNGIKLDKATPKEGILTQLKASDVMQQRVETLSSKMRVDEAVQAFSRSHHRGFPVVDNGKLVGIVTQSDLAAIDRRALPPDTPLEAIMTPKPVTVGTGASLADVLYLLNRYQLSRLPVVEGRKLVGIITRADIIRVEADRLGGKNMEIGPRPQPSYVVYQTRSPSVGKGRLLVPLANPHTADALLQIAAAIACDRDYELVCLQIILVGRHNSPEETPVRTTSSRRLLRKAESIGRQWHLPVHTEVRVAHDVAFAILETIEIEHIDLLVMGWNAEPPSPGRIFGSAIDTAIRQAACEVVLVKLGATRVNGEEDTETPRHGDAESKDVLALPCLPLSASSSYAQCPIPLWDRWLVPMGGGPNAECAVRLLPALVALGYAPKIRLCQVFKPSEAIPTTPVLDRAAQNLRQQLDSYSAVWKGKSGRKTPIPVLGTHIRGNSVSEAVTKLAKFDGSDVVLLGASREGFLEQAIKGNIPCAIARGCDCTVILVRGKF
ncbi:chloride channel protein [Microseira sp. BLCC-F43]|uniref:chloride channel protein n=1 Tax=Microseira sp. BLCC-F43 TaxID=3153602 RepID=UPI0035BA1CE8